MLLEMKPLSILLTAILVALPAASVAHTCKCGSKRRLFIFCLQLLYFGRQGHRMTMMKSSVQSTKDILTMTPQLHTPGKYRWICTWDDTHGDIDRAYPHIFGNKENLDFKRCKKGTLVEYPLKKSETPWDGGSPPGADRVVYLWGKKTFCGASDFFQAGETN